MPGLDWLPTDCDWRARFDELPRRGARLIDLQQVAAHNLDFVQTGLLDKRLHEASGEMPKIRLAILASSTVDQIIPGLRIAALRRGFLLDIYLPHYGQYRSVVLNKESELYAFAPDVVLFSIDAEHFCGSRFIINAAEAEQHVQARVSELRMLWTTLLSRLPCQIIQQTLIPKFAPILGSGEYRVPGTPASMVQSANSSLREAAVTASVDICAVDARVAFDGLADWYSPALWHRSKQEISPIASPFYGELVLRLIDAQQGRSSKCLVLDLDNTLWGGVIGDDGLEGIELGQGSAAGEAFTDLQHWVQALSRRGVILAVCSKNEEANGREPFQKHPEMVLKESDIAAFAINWDDKATNIRRIASALNIGLDSLVFLDDNPFERNIVRRELPMVKVPEVPEDPAEWAACLSTAGYFEAVTLTNEDLQRGDLYQATRELREQTVPQADLESYLKSLDMRLAWGRFDAVSLRRVTQLINKTNQFNLTTKRYTDAETTAMIADPSMIALHFRLTDRFADHGIISVVIGRAVSSDTLEVDTWLMSCRVLGRGVERAVFSVLVDAARKRGFANIIGRYIATAKNGIVRDFFETLGFQHLESDGSCTVWQTSTEIPVDQTGAILIEALN